MQVRTGSTEDDIAAAIQIDLSVTGTHGRASYIEAVAERGGLRLAIHHGRVVGFCCLDDHYFFEKAFVSLLIVDRGSRRNGIGQVLLETTSSEQPETWTSTNRSNAEMRGLLSKSGWKFCGEIEGLDAGDPELFFKRSD